MQGKKVFEKRLLVGFVVIGVCMGLSGCKAKEKTVEIETAVSEKEELELQEEAATEFVKGEIVETQELTEEQESVSEEKDFEKTKPDTVNENVPTENEDADKEFIQESITVPEKGTEYINVPESVPEQAPTPAVAPDPSPESVPVPSPEEPVIQTGFVAEKESVLFSKINASRGGDLQEGSWAKNKAREKAKAADGSGSGVLYGFDTTGDASAMADSLIASYGSTIGMNWKSFGCGVYQNGGIYYYCVVFDTMTD